MFANENAFLRLEISETTCIFAPHSNLRIDAAVAEILGDADGELLELQKLLKNILPIYSRVQKHRFRLTVNGNKSTSVLVRIICAEMSNYTIII